MDENKWLTAFESNREHLQRVAFRILGSLSEAEDALQEAWLRLKRAEPREIDNPTGWLTTVVARLCLDQLRSRRETVPATEQEHVHAEGVDPEEEIMLADAVGVALLVVLHRLAPAERLAFVLHDLFDLPFDQIAPVVGRTPSATRQLASRARRRVNGSDLPSSPERPRQHVIVDAFLAATRSGDMQALLEVLDPDVVLRTDASALPSGKPIEVRGAAELVRLAARGALRAARATQMALIDGEVGIVIAPRGQLKMVLRLTIASDKIFAIDAVAEPERLKELTLHVLTSST